jgi:hypothetical protein
MTQFVDNSTEEKKFWNIYSALVEQTEYDIETYFNTAYRSKALGEGLYDNKVIPIYKTLEKSLFVKAFSQIVEGEKTLGSIEAYLKILYAIFGSTAKITISQTQPLHLQIDIVAPVRTHYIWKVRKHDKVIITKAGNYLVFRKLLAEVTNRELLQILKATTKAGTYIEFTLNKEEVLG